PKFAGTICTLTRFGSPNGAAGSVLARCSAVYAPSRLALAWAGTVPESPVFDPLIGVRSTTLTYRPGAPATSLLCLKILSTTSRWGSWGAPPPPPPPPPPPAPARPTRPPQPDVGSLIGGGGTVDLLMRMTNSAATSTTAKAPATTKVSQRWT